MKDKKFGTVGAVACDGNGNIAAATSTGGMTNKRYGRIGDSPLIGAGTYANNKTCAISCTGHGEIFIKAVAAYDVSCLMEYKNMNLLEACEEVVLKKLSSITWRRRINRSRRQRAILPWFLIVQECTVDLETVVEIILLPYTEVDF